MGKASSHPVTDRDRDHADSEHRALPVHHDHVPAARDPRTVLGNRSVRALLAQAKLRVGASFDPLEMEADRVAADVVRTLTTHPAPDQAEHDCRGPACSVHGQAPADASLSLRRAADVDRAPIGAAGGDVRAVDETEINRARRGGGAALPADFRARVEPVMGADFSDVRVHTGPEAAQLNRSFGASAFTVGNDIFFRDRMPDVRTAKGTHLVSHELTHTIQQGGAPTVHRQVSVQRLMTTKPSHLDKYISTGDAIKTAVGKGNESKKTFSAIRSALADYRSEAGKRKADPAMQATRLATLDVLCRRFINENPPGERRAIIDRLMDEIAAERVAITQRQAQDIYSADLKSSSPSERDPSKRAGFKALGSEGQKAGTDQKYGLKQDREKNIQEAKAKYGVTDAEVAAIRVFSAGDFRYINPATANSPAWLASEKAKDPEGMGKLDDKTLMQEGSLHTAVAEKGLAKMKPYKGEVYRGARYTPEEFSQKFAVGKKSSFTTLASSSKNKSIALDFAHGISSGGTPDKQKSVAVLAILTETGGVDISQISLFDHEAEVLIRPGSVFHVQSVKEVDGNVAYANHVSRATNLEKPLPTKWYEVRLSPWRPAKATGSQLPMSTPIDEYLRKAGKPTQHRVGGHR